MKNSILIKCTLLILCISFNSCLVQDGEDGVDGIDGKNGIDGIDGIDGINGQDGQDGAPGATGPQGNTGNDGQDGAGLEEMAQYGSITMNLNGTRPDDIPFTSEATFEFSTLDGTDIDNYNSVVTTQSGNDVIHIFNLRRFITSPSETYNAGFIQWSDFIVTNLGTENQDIELLDEIWINNHAVILEGNKYFIIDNHLASEDIIGFTITNLIFDINDNNHLTFSYSFSVDAADNDSGNELNVSGEVDVYLFELIEP
jgi:hypothetical protein